MKRLLYIAISILPLLALTSCSTAEVERRLDLAESLMAERPDSSYVILRDIDIDDVCSRGVRARYAILLTQAQDKNYIDETDITLISEAKEYYEDKNDIEALFKVYYYIGRIYFNAGAYTQAILSYTKAEELVHNIKDNYAVALLYAQIGIINDIIYDYEKSLDAFLMAHDYYELAGRETHKNYTKLSIGYTYLNIKQYELAETYLYETLEWSYENGDSNLCESCVDYLILLYEEIGNNQKLHNLVDSKFIHLCNESFVMHLSRAFLYACDGKREMSETCLNEVRDMASMNDEEELLLFREYKIYRVLGDYKKALECHERVLAIQDSIVRITLRQPLLTTQRDYFHSQAKYNALELEHAHQLQIWIIVVSILLIGIVALVIRRRILLKNIAIRHYMELTHNLEQTLFSKSNDVEGMSAMITDMNQHINNLFESQFSLIDKLSNTYYETHSTKRDKEAIYGQVRSEIEKLQTDKMYIMQLEDIVNKYKDNVMFMLRESMPEFREMDFRLLCFIYAGFSAKAISVFTGDSIGNIYMKKSRLKAKIAQSNNTNKDTLLTHLL